MPKGKERRVRGRSTEQHQTQQRAEPIDEEPDKGVSILSNNEGNPSVSGDETDHGAIEHSSHSGGLNPNAPVGTHSPRVTPAPDGAGNISHFPEGEVIPETGKFSNFPGGVSTESVAMQERQERRSSGEFLSSGRLPPPFSFHPLLLTYDLEDDVNDPNSDSDSGDTMSTSSSTLNEAAKIKPLQGRDDWIEWDEKLQGQLGMIDLYVILTDPTHRPSPEDNPKEHRKWDEYQRRLRALLLCITGPHPKSLLMNSQSLTAVEQYALLKAEYNTQTITTFSHLYRKIHRCGISSHKSLKEYSEEFIKTRNKLQQLGQPIPSLQLVCAFLDGLDSSYQGWKDQLFSHYISHPTQDMIDTKGNTYTIMNILNMEELVKQLTDREDRIKKSNLREPGTTRAFGTRGSSSSKTDQPKCHTCGAPHLKTACFFSNVEKAPDSWKAKFDTAEKRKAQLEIARKRYKWESPKPTDQQRAYIAHSITANGGSKDPNWYADCAASSHLTHDISIFLSTDLDDHVEEIRAADGAILRTRGSGTIALATLVNRHHSFVHLHNVHYCPEIDTNLLSLGALEAKGLQFSAKHALLEIRDPDSDTVFQARRHDNVYPLSQPTPLAYQR